MIVWLWDADGPTVSGRGITDDEAKARKAAETYVRSGVAISARAEMAVANIGIHALTSGYERVGQGWTVRRYNNGRIAWEPSDRKKAEGIMSIPSTEYVEALLRRAYPDADFIVTPEADGLYVEIQGDSFALHWTVTDEQSILLPVLEQLAEANRGTAP
jgi:hypothetical protein